MESVELVAAGEELLAPPVLRRIVQHYVSTPPWGLAPSHIAEELSERELEVFRLIGRGFSAIAAELVISMATVKTHVRHVLAKLRLRDRVQAVVAAHEVGLV